MNARSISGVGVALLVVLLVVAVGGTNLLIGVASTEEHGEVVSINHDATVEPDAEFNVTIETAKSAGTVVEFDLEGIEVDLSSEDAVRIEDNRVEFLDVNAGDSAYTITVNLTDGEDADAIGITAWVNAEDRTSADDSQSSTITIDGTTGDGGAVLALNHDATVEPDAEFNVTIGTANSAGTVVEFDLEGIEADLSSEDAVRIEDNRVEFLDVNAGDSMYTINVDIISGDDGDTGEISAWVNAENRENAADEQISSFTIAANDPGEFEVAIDSPIESVVEGEVIEVAAVITNTGDIGGTKEVTLQITEDQRWSEDISLQAGESGAVTFDVDTRDASLTAGQYDVVVSSENTSDISTLSVLAPATFEVTGLSPEEMTVTRGDVIPTIEATIENTGDSEDTQTLELVIDDSTVETQEVELGSGETATVTFSDIETEFLPEGTQTFLIETADDETMGSLLIEDQTPTTGSPTQTTETETGTQANESQTTEISGSTEPAQDNGTVTKTEAESPGFGVFLAVIALLVGALLIKQRET